MSEPKITHVYLGLSGLAIVLGGDLQAAVYLAVLARPNANIAQIKRYIEVYHGFRNAYTTVSTTAEKLCEKNILKRETNPTKHKTEYHYNALITDKELIAYAKQLVSDAMDRLDGSSDNGSE